MRPTIYHYCAALVILALSAPAMGNAANVLIVTGSATDADGKPLAAAEITVTNLTKNLTLAQRTENDGAYVFTFLDFFGGSVADAGDAVTVSVKQEGQVVKSTVSIIDAAAFDASGQTARVNIDIQLDAAAVMQLNVTRITPNSALASGGASVQIIGEGFREGISVAFGESEATRVDVVSDTELSVTVPAGDRGVVDVVATNPDGRSSAIRFSYLDYPPWDVNRSGMVDILDLVLVANHLGETGQEVTGDIDKNGTVNILDLVQVAKHLGEHTAPSVSD